MAINRDSIVAIFLLLFCGVMLHASFDIRDPGHGMMAPATWPQVVLLVFGGSQLPKLAKNLGKAQKEFKDGLAEGQAEGDEATSDTEKTS